MSMDAVQFAMAHNDISATRKFVLVTLAFYADEKGYVSMSISKLSDITGLSQSTIVTSINYLCDKRLLKRTEVGNIHERKATEYRVRI
jgi:predicted transcriptional regulator